MRSYRKPDVGTLKKRVSVQSRSQSIDAYGQPLDSWADIASPVWARIDPISGNEKMRAMAIASQLTHSVILRYKAAFVPPTESTAFRILYGTRIFNIVAAIDIEESHDFIVFECTEGSRDGQ